MKNKERLRNCYRLEETGGNKTTKSNVGHWIGFWKKKASPGGKREILMKSEM